MEELEKEEPSLVKVKTAVYDSFELLARRESIRPHLHKAAHIANRDQPITENLFGDEVEAEMKKIEVASKLHQSMKATDKTKKISNLKNRFKSFLGHTAGQGNKYSSPAFKKAPYQGQKQWNQQRGHQHHQKYKKGTPAKWKKQN